MDNRLVNDYFQSQEEAMRKALQRPDNESLFKRLYYFRWYQSDSGLKDSKKKRTIQFEEGKVKEPIEVLICLVEGIYDALTSYCEFIS